VPDRGVHQTGTGSIHRRADVKILLRADKAPVAEIANKYGVGEQTLYAWRTKYGAPEAADVKQLRSLQRENERLRKMLAERDLAIEVMREINAKRWLARPRAAARPSTRCRSACRSDARARLWGVARSTVGYELQQPRSGMPR
jgi:putative transposase